MTVVRISTEAGAFAEDKDLAASIREDIILPALERGNAVALDFEGVTLTTQSFVHALVSQALREHGEAVLEKLVFRNCSELVRGLVEAVVQYTLDAMDLGSDL